MRASGQPIQARGQPQIEREPARTPRRHASVATHDAVRRRIDAFAGRARRYSAIVMPAGIVGAMTYGLKSAVPEF